MAVCDVRRVVTGLLVHFARSDAVEFDGVVEVQVAEDVSLNAF